VLVLGSDWSIANAVLNSDWLITALLLRFLIGPKKLVREDGALIADW